MAPAGTPARSSTRLRGEMVRILAQPDFRKKLDDVGMELTTRTPAEFAAAIPGEIQQWAQGDQGAPASSRNNNVRPAAYTAAATAAADCSSMVTWSGSATTRSSQAPMAGKAERS